MIMKEKLQDAAARARLEYAEKEANLEKEELIIEIERKIWDERRTVSEVDARVNVMEAMMKENSQGDLDSLSSIKEERTKDYIAKLPVHTYPRNPSYK